MFVSSVIQNITLPASQSSLNIPTTGAKVPGTVTHSTRPSDGLDPRD